ncbi:GLPGLI family protein [Pedobacter frigoris]|uniref:GLPGLI family protein n=1 Tax=Pedobacter frigoris TaxID=2571272 RepID=A0A4U1CSB6_9SPHI|nr:GLPGLI family protein [Pedobacter frigoris]TKC08809.1 GLPGLI family protein [Pedobacter frigoris]
MKYYLSFCLLFCLTYCAQAQKLHVEYEYIPSAMATFREQVYYIDAMKTAVRDSIPVAPTAGDADNASDEISADFSMMLNTGTNYRRIVIQKSGERDLGETRSLQGKNYLVMDKFPVIEWNTNYTETDTLGKYICHKATADYRGTKLIAYYTNEIPVPAGPYKFGGLPGLIVMLYNEGANPHYWLLKKVSYPYNGDIPVDEKYIYSLPKLLLEDYVKKDEVLIEEQMRIMESKMPVMEGVTVERNKVRGTVEQVYEWESGKRK